MESDKEKNLIISYINKHQLAKQKQQSDFAP